MGSFQTSDGRTLGYRRKGSGPILVCHPGGPGFSGREFGDFADLADTLTLVFLDPRGTGSSDPPADPSAYRLQDFAADLEELRLHLDLERMDVLGFSHGGMVAAAYAVAYPRGIGRLVLASSLARVGPAQQEEAERLIAEHTGEPWYEQAVLALHDEEHGSHETPEDVLRLWKQMAPLYFVRWDAAAAAFIDDTSSIGSVEAGRLFNADPPDLLNELARISAPTLVLAGEEDFICGPASARELAEGIAGARLVLLPQAGHFTYYEQPRLFAEAVTAFLADGVPQA